jgi:predicted ester cyclase
LIAEGDFVAGRWIGGGTHTGAPFEDLVVGGLSLENTGKKMRFSGITIFTLKDGKIVKEVGEEGGMSALQQLGILPGPKEGKEIFYDVEA